MAFFTAGKVFELQKYTENQSLNGKIVGIIDRKDQNETYPVYIFETQQIVNVTAAQMTYPDLDADTKTKLQSLLKDVAEQKKQHRIDLAVTAEQEEQQRLLLQQRRDEEAKIQAVIPSVVFDGDSISQSAATPNQIVVHDPPSNLYQSEGDEIMRSQSTTVPSGYALVPVATLKEVVDLKEQSQEIRKKEIELISKENELHLDRREMAMEIRRKEQELAMNHGHLSQMERDLRRQQMEHEVHRSTAHNRGHHQHRNDDERRRKRPKQKKKRKKRKKKEDGCTTTKCCKWLCQMSTLCFVLALCAGTIGVYFYFLRRDDENLYAFIAWAGGIVAVVLGIGFWCKG